MTAREPADQPDMTIGAPPPTPEAKAQAQRVVDYCGHVSPAQDGKRWGACVPCIALALALAAAQQETP